MKISCPLLHTLSDTRSNTFSLIKPNKLTRTKYHVLSRTLTTILFTLPCLLTAQVTHYAPRPQGHNAARESVGNMHRMLYKKRDTVHGTFAYGFEYARSWRPDDITKTLFPTAQKTPCGCGITISGSAVENRGATDWLADYFGLPTDFQSTVGFEPRIDNFMAPLTYHIGLDEWIHGFYFTVQSPLVHTRWTLNPGEHIIARGVNGYPAGYFTANAVPRANLLQSFMAFASNEQVPTLAASTDYIPVTFRALDYGKISCSRHTRTRLADITAVLGWNFVERQNYHVGANIRTVIPAGNTPKGYYLFEPIVGNGHHWELGFGMTSHWDFWHNKTNDRTLTLYIDASATHLFDSNQKRTFDFINKPYSRYMLMQQLENNQDSDPRLGDAFPHSEFDGMLTPLANVSSFNVNVSIGVQTDMVALISYSSETCSFDLGYNFWARSCENIERTCSGACALPATFAANNTTLAPKGNAYVIGFEDTSDDPVRLGATQQNATIYNGTNPTGDTVNTGIDNATLATSNNSLTILNAPAGTQTRSSNPLLFPSAQDLDLCGAQTRSLTHKIFAHFEHTWITCAHWTPHLGIGGEIEFGDNKSCCKPHCTQKCISCSPCSLSQWGVWILSGISF